MKKQIKNPRARTTHVAPTKKKTTILGPTEITQPTPAATTTTPEQHQQDAPPQHDPPPEPPPHNPASEAPAPESPQENRHQVSFPVTPFQEELLDLLKNTDPPAKWPAINSIKHLNRAWRLLDHDPTMAVFRGITSEEEAATALFWSLQRLRYPGATALNHRNHVHKQAVIPFLDAAQPLLATTNQLMTNVKLEINRTLIPRTIAITFDVAHPAFTGLRGTSPRPLDFYLLPNGQAPDLKHELAQLATKNGAATIIDALRTRARLRNQLLYANTNGINELRTPTPTILQRQQHSAFRLLTILLLVDPHPQEQGFVTQLLRAFLNMLNIAPKNLQFD